MSINIIEGIVGSGKSVILTRHGYWACRKGEPVYANYNLNFPHRRLNLEEIISELPRLRNATILFDEAQNQVSARTFMSARNIMFSKFVKQTRKAGINLYLATQQALGIDIDIRRNVHVNETVYPYRLVQNDEGQRFLRKATLQEIEGRHVDRIMVKKELYWAQEGDNDPPVEWTLVNPEPYFGLYDTTETFDI